MKRLKRIIRFWRFDSRVFVSDNSRKRYADYYWKKKVQATR